MVVVLAAGWLGASEMIGRSTATRHAAQVDRALAAVPFLKVEERRYERGLFAADSRLVVRLALPEMPAPAKRAGPAGPGQPERFVPPVVRLVVQDRIAHGPFPAGLRPAAARIHTTVTATVETPAAPTDAAAPTPSTAPAAGTGAAAGPDAAPVLLTADTVVGFSNDFTSRFASPAGEWRFGEGAVRLVWSGLDGDASGDLATMVSRYAMRSPGFSLQVSDSGPRAATGAMTMTVDGLAAQGRQGPSSGSLRLMPGEGEATAASVKVDLRPQAGTPVALALTDLKSRQAITLDGELMGMATTTTGQGTFNDVRIDRFEMVERWGRLHAPTLERMLDRLLAVYREPTLPEPQAMVEPLLEELRALLPYGPRHEIERLDVTVDGRTGHFTWRVALPEGTTADADPMALARRTSAALSIKLPQAWIEPFVRSSGAGAAQLPVADLLKQGEQMGFLKVDGETIASEARLDGGRVDVNGRHVFTLPPGR